MKLNNDFRTSLEIKKGWWIEERATVPCILPADGLLAVFRLVDVELLLDSNYPWVKERYRKVWFFNGSKDREIAESSNDRVYANPQILWRHYLSL